MALGRSWRVRQCPIPLITPFSWTLLDIFQGCHGRMPGWSGTSFVQFCWPTATTLFEEKMLFVQAFRTIRSEIEAVQAETRED